MPWHGANIKSKFNTSWLESRLKTVYFMTASCSHLGAKAHKLEKTALTWHSSGMEMEKNLASANICSTFSFTYQLDNFRITIKMYSRRVGRIRNIRSTTLSTPSGRTQDGGVAGLAEADDGTAAKSKSWARFMCFARLCDNKTKPNETKQTRNTSCD